MRSLLMVLLGIVFPLLGPSLALAETPSPVTPPQTVVVWVSVDGFSGDYLDRLSPASTPFLSGLRSSGVWTRRLMPVYPSLTFTVHAAQATGASAAVTGIPGNTVFDRPAWTKTEYPSGPALLNAEPIWTSATRQGVRVAVIDWPFSQNQKGDFAAAYCSPPFDGKMSDDQRVQKLIDLMRYDDGGPQKKPLTLLMTYISSLDKTGHELGPDSPAIVEQLRRIDTMLRALNDQARTYVQTHLPPGAELYFLVSTDHGMAPVSHVMSLEKIFAGELPPGAKIVVGGPTAHVFLLESPDKPAQIARLVAVLRKYDCLRVFTHADLASAKARWRLLDPNRIGDLYVEGKPGYTFNEKGAGPAVQTLADARAATTRPTDRKPPSGMHGWDPLEVRQMQGALLLSRWPNDLSGQELSAVDSRALAATVSTLLRIAPPNKAEAAAEPELIGRD
jgi:hypothetical protein